MLIGLLSVNHIILYHIISVILEITKLNKQIWFFIVAYVTITVTLVSMENSRQKVADRHRQFILMITHVAMVTVRPKDLICRVNRTHHLIYRCAKKSK